jgi:hypothetical protein
MPTLSEDLVANPENPREISPQRLQALARTLREYGELGCIIKNVYDGEGGGLLIGGHARVAVLQDDPNAQVIIDKHYSTPTATGTVAEGYVISRGESYNYREVSWPRHKAMMAAIAANKNAGDWNEHELVNWMQELHEADQDLNLSMFAEDEWQCLLPDEIPEHIEDETSAEPSQPTPREAPTPSAKPEPAREPMQPLLPGAQVKQVQLFYAERDHAEFLRMVGVIQAKFGHENISEAVMEAVQQASEA